MDTIISRFSKSFGVPVQMKHFPIVIGSTRKDIGLTTDLETITTSWYLRFKEENHRMPTKRYRITPIEDELAGNHCFWTKDDLMKCMHVLDNKPFSRLALHYFPFEVLPLAITRDNISVVIAPRVLTEKEYPEPVEKEWVGNVWHTGKFKPNWIRPLYNSTFWLVRFNGSEIVKCYVCGTELEKQDYINQVILRYHPRCICSCSTYDDFCGCVRMRERMEYEKKSREVVLIRHWQRSKWG